jgi:Domain of unknown function (DUF4124)
MGRASAWILTAAVLLVCGSSHAQIYSCVGKDGSRVFSDQRCGPDAQVVPGIGKTKRTPPKGTGAPRPVKTRRSAEELEVLTSQCDAGDMKACTAWTMGGGPELLRDRERKAEQECEAGSLAACEERYCREGINADCRSRVQRTARLAGDTWYVRDETRNQPGGLTKYLIRCIPAGVRESRDILVNCSSEAGPNRCFLADPQQGFSRLANAAASYCSRQ